MKGKHLNRFDNSLRVGDFPNKVFSTIMIIVSRLPGRVSFCCLEKDPGSSENIERDASTLEEGKKEDIFALQNNSE